MWRMTHVTRGRRIAAVALSMVVIGAATVAVANGVTGSIARSPRAQAHIAKATRVPAALEAAFPSLRRGRVADAGTALPQELTAQLENPSVSPELGLNPQLATQLATDEPAAMWLVPGSQGVCLVEGNPYPETAPAAEGSAVCSSTAEALEQGIVIDTRYSADNTQIVGVAPEVVEEVTGAQLSRVGHRSQSKRVVVRDRGGRKRRVRVAVDGSFHLSDSHAATLLIKGSRGVRSLNLR